jgi:MarR family transcriptional regulator, organic hydroperoxide resistance regulator
MLASLERAAHLIGVHAERAGRELGITQAEVHVLVQLARRGATPIATLHREFGTKRSTLTNVLDRLEGHGFVRRELRGEDRRSFTIHLTRIGAVQARRLAKVMDELEAAVRSAVEERDLRGVEAVVDALHAATRQVAASSEGEQPLKA